jgi:diadenosine tetraphosphatase ApaH/serine/threonine PP2A family protein phosphatase
MKRLFGCCPRYCFHAHTHIPGIVTEERRYYSPDEIDNCWRLDDRKALINVGSVGQPRDGDRRACYVLFDGQTIRFRRVEYDVEKTIKKVYAIPELDNFLGDRLRKGR